MNRRLMKRPPEARYIGVGYRDKGARRNLTEDGNQSWQEVAMTNPQTLPLAQKIKAMENFMAEYDDHFLKVTIPKEKMPHKIRVLEQTIITYGILGSKSNEIQSNTLVQRALTHVLP